MPEFQLEPVARKNHPSLEVVKEEPQARPSRYVFDNIRQELDGYYAGMRQYPQLEPDMVLLDLSGVAARLTEIRAFLVRDNSQQANALRTKEVDPLLAQVDVQFKIHSRVQAIREFDLKMTGPMT
jgi:hypothetical protein